MESCAIASRITVQRPSLASFVPRRPHARRLLSPVQAKLSGPKPSSGNNNTPNFFTNDIVSSGLGAMVCTSFFVSRGQDPWTALSITVAAAVVALAVEKLVFEER